MLEFPRKSTDGSESNRFFAGRAPESGSTNLEIPPPGGDNGPYHLEPVERTSMSIMQHVSVLAVRPLVVGACRLTGLMVADSLADGVTRFLSERFFDHGQRLTDALRYANQRAWRSLEIALAGESLLTWLDRGEDRVFREQVRQFLRSWPTDGQPPLDDSFRAETLRELRAARKAGLLESPSLDAHHLAQQCGALARHTNPAALLQAEWEVLASIAEAVRAAAYLNLARYLTLQPPSGDSLLALAVRFYFRREVEKDTALFQGLAFAQLDQLTHALDSGFTALNDALTAHGDRLESLLDDVRTLTEATHSQVLDLRAEMAKQSQQLQELSQSVLAALQARQLDRRALRPTDSMSLSNEQELREVQTLVRRFRALPPEQRQHVPALWNAIGKLEVAAGDFQSAQQVFRELVGRVDDPAAKAEAEHNRYRTALELQQWDEALEAIREAMRLSPERFAPFPPHKFEAERILGAGGFGVAYLCRNRHSGARVVIKSLRLDGLERSVADVFREAQVLEELDHPAIIRVRDCDFADADQSRPFIVMDYFAGETLADHVAQHGPIPLNDLLPLARQIADGLHAAHERGVLHRDVKPANILVRRRDDGWRIKLIDFGLALRQRAIRSTLVSTTSTLPGRISGTLDYAAPEQLGRLPGGKIGRPADVYGFARTLCFALFQTTQPLRRHWSSLPDQWADLLEQCLAESPQERPASFATILDRLGGTPIPKPAPVVAEEPKERKFWASVPSGTASGERILTGHRGPVRCVAVTSDGKWIISGGEDGMVRVWDAATGREVHQLEGHQKEVCSLALVESPGGVRVWSSSSDQSVREWNLTRGILERTFDRRTNRTIAISPRGDLAATGSVHDGIISVWALDTGREMRRLKGHTSWVNGLAFSLNGVALLSLGADETIRFWDVDQGRQLRCITVQGGVTSGLFLNHEYAVTGGHDRMVHVWNMIRGQRKASFAGHRDVVTCVAVAPERRLIASGSADQTIRLWEPRNEREQKRFEGHEAAVRALAFTPNGSHLISVSDDGTVRIWPVPA